MSAQTTSGTIALAGTIAQLVECLHTWRNLRTLKFGMDTHSLFNQLVRGIIAHSRIFAINPPR